MQYLETISSTGYLISSTGYMTCCGFSVDGQYLLTAGQQLRVWEHETQALIASWPLGEPPQKLLALPDGQRLILQFQMRLELWNWRKGLKLETVTAYSQDHLVLSPYGPYLLSGISAFKLMLWRLDVHGLIKLSERKGEGKKQQACFHPDGKHVLIVSQDHASPRASEITLLSLPHLDQETIWPAPQFALLEKTDAPMFSPTQHDLPTQGPIDCLAISPSGSYLALLAKTQDTLLFVFDLASQRQLKAFPQTARLIDTFRSQGSSSLAFTDDEHLLVTGNKQIEHWNWRTETLLKSQSIPWDSVSIHTGRQRMASVNYNRLELYDLSDMTSLEIHAPELQVRQLTFHPQSSRLTILGQACGFTLDLEAHPSHIAPHQIPAEHCAFSPDGRLLAEVFGSEVRVSELTGAEKRAIFKYDVPSRKDHQKGSPFGPVLNLAFSSDSRRLHLLLDWLPSQYRGLQYSLECWEIEHTEVTCHNLELDDPRLEIFLQPNHGTCGGSPLMIGRSWFLPEAGKLAVLILRGLNLGNYPIMLFDLDSGKLTAIYGIPLLRQQILALTGPHEKDSPSDTEALNALVQSLPLNAKTRPIRDICTLPDGQLMICDPHTLYQGMNHEFKPVLERPKGLNVYQAFGNLSPSCDHQLVYHSPQGIEWLNLESYVIERKVPLAQLTSLCISDDQRWLAALDEQGIIHILHTLRGLIYSLFLDRNGHYLAWTPDGSYDGDAYALRHYLAHVPKLQTGSHRPDFITNLVSELRDT